MAEYREQAAACFAVAKQLSLISERRRMTDMGAEWLRLAADAAMIQPL
jgi:hypothetical protein